MEVSIFIRVGYGDTGAISNTAGHAIVFARRSVLNIIDYSKKR